MVDETIFTLLKLTWVSIKGNWAVGAEPRPMIQSAPQVERGSRADLNTFDVDDWSSVSQALVIEFPGGPEIKVILLATNVTKSQWQQKERSEKKKKASAQEQEKQRECLKLWWHSE